MHEGFTPEELLRVECVPQNKESAEGGRVLKSNAGRARKFAAKRGNELVSEEQSSTIACVSGFLFNMVDRTVKLISPCNASDRWPLGYWVIAEGTFGTADELRDLMRSMIDDTIRDSLGVLDTVRLRHDVRIVVGPERLRVVSMGLGLAFENQPQADELAELLAAGTYTVEQIALRRRQAAGVPPAETLAVLDRLFLGGFFDEEPPAPESPAGKPRAGKCCAGTHRAAPAHGDRAVSGMNRGMTSAPELATCSPAVAGAAGEREAPDVCLVTMPYASPTRPSMALGLLKAILAEGGISASVAYANLWFAESTGLRRYSLCASNMPIVFLAGEWTFAGAAFPDDPRRAERDAEYLRQVRQASDGSRLLQLTATGRPAE